MCIFYNNYSTSQCVFEKIYMIKEAKYGNLLLSNIPIGGKYEINNCSTW